MELICYDFVVVVGYLICEFVFGVSLIWVVFVEVVEWVFIDFDVLFRRGFGVRVINRR